MSSEYTADLPSIFPQRAVRVDREKHRYEITQGSSGTILEKTEYVLEKAPIDYIVEVVGVEDGRTRVFSNGDDYELSGDSTKLIWDEDADHKPDPGSTFFVTYEADSILGRYNESSAEELQLVDEQIQDVINAKFIDGAEDDELDQLGAIFGELGKRQGRPDPQYRTYLKSIVQSFVSRGTTNGIKVAVAAAVGIEDQENLDKIEIIEDFDENGYEIALPTVVPMSTSIITQVAEVSDPSGVEHLLTRFRPEPDEMVSGDTATFTLNQSYLDEMVANDVATADDTAYGGDDEMLSDDTADTTVQQNVHWGNNWSTDMDWV